MRAGCLLPVGLISAATLAYEVLLMRLFSIVQWHHFAYMIISIALLGFGASGTFVALARRPLVERYPAAFAASAALFGITAVASFAGAERLPFNRARDRLESGPARLARGQLCSPVPAVLFRCNLYRPCLQPPS